MKQKIIILCTILFLVFLLVGFTSHGFAALGYNALQWAAINNHTKTAKVLLAVGAPPSPYKEIYEIDYFSALKDTPLHSAARTGNVELVKNLIENDANLDWCCCSCITALHLAIINKHPEIVKILLEAGAVQRTYNLELSVIELAENQSTNDIIEIIKSYNKANSANTKNRVAD